MAKDPAFLFYPGDFMQGTQTFTREEKGAYMDLLILQFNEGHLSLDLIKRCLNGDFERIWPFLQKKFAQDENGFFFSKRLETEIEKRKNYSASRRSNREKKKDMNNICETHVDTYVAHMENENENRNINKDVLKKGVQGETKEELFTRLFLDEQWTINIQKTHAGKDFSVGWDQCHLHHSQSPRPPETIWEWRQKFSTWLSIMKPSEPLKGPGTKKKKSFAEFNKGKE